VKLPVVATNHKNKYCQQQTRTDFPGGFFFAGEMYWPIDVKDK
jgi:hypothetical protein